MAARKNYTAAQIINGLRRAEVGSPTGSDERGDPARGERARTTGGGGSTGG